MELSITNQPEIYIDPLTDFGFKHLFGNEAHKEIMISFLNALLEGQKLITNISFTGTEYSGDDKDIKRVLFDLQCTDQDGDIFIFEMQRQEQKFFKDRCIYYASRSISQQLKRGKTKENAELKGVYLIGLLDFTFKNHQRVEYLTDNLIMNIKTNNIFYNKLSYRFIELPNFTKNEVEIVTELDKWIYLLKNMSSLSVKPSFLDTRIFKQIFNMAKISKLTKEERMRNDSNLKAQMDYNSNIAYKLKEGAHNKAVEVALKLKNLGYNTSQIIEITDLSKDEIESL